MNKQIEKLQIVLENCEIITVEGKHIGHFSMEDITQSINRVACNYIGESFTCKDFSISIHRDCSLNKKSEWIMGTLDGKERNPLRRILQFNDITSIYIYFKGKKESKQIYFSWGDDDYNNEYQESYMNKFGDLFIVISKNLKLEDVFDKEEIEDEKHLKFLWSVFK